MRVLRLDHRVRRRVRGIHHRVLNRELRLDDRMRYLLGQDGRPTAHLMRRVLYVLESGVVDLVRVGLGLG